MILVENHEKWSHLLHLHPQWDDIKILLDCCRRIIQIAHTAFKKDDPIIDEFETVVATLRAVVVKSFNGRKGDADIEVFEGDETGYRFDYPEGGLKFVKDKEVGYKLVPIKRSWPHLLFKNGFYQHQVYDHLIKFMRRNGDILKYSSWVIEAANRDWKRILLSGITLGGKAEGNGDSYHPARQALEYFLRIVHPDIVVHQVRDLRTRGVYHCGDCGLDKPPGHSRVCALRGVARVIRARPVGRRQ